MDLALWLMLHHTKDRMMKRQEADPLVIYLVFMNTPPTPTSIFPINSTSAVGVWRGMS
jgi:hypothetical protein